MPIQRSPYRQPPTAEGLKLIEKGELDYFDPELYRNANTGVLERYLDEKNRGDGFENSVFKWKNVFMGIFIGSCFAIINQYVGLKVGIIVSGAWYLSYVIGLIMKWKPTEINITCGATTGASATAAGFVFSFPAIFILAYSEDFSGSGIITPEGLASYNVLFISVIAAMFSGILGVFYFIILRKIWIVEDPLPCPGFEASVKLCEISHFLSRGEETQAKTAIRKLATWISIVGTFVFFRDFPINRMNNSFAHFTEHGADPASIMDNLFKGVQWYDKGELIQPNHTVNLTRTRLGIGILPMQFAIGWFMNMKTALLVFSGTALTWLVIIPLAISIDTPIVNTATMTGSPISMYWDPDVGLTPVKMAYGLARYVAIGAILGGGITSLLKMSKTFKGAVTDAFAIKNEGGNKAYVKDKGWYEWPASHIMIMGGITIIGVALAFWVGGFPLFASLIFASLLAIFTFFISAIAVKVSGEIRKTPVSGTSFIVLLLLIGVFRYLLKLPIEQTAIMAIVGTTVFGICVSLSADITWDFKLGLYVGTRPYHLVKGETTGLIPGMVVAGIAATFFSMNLAKGTLALPAPQAYAFAATTEALLGGNARYDLLVIGFFVGVFAEFVTGMGTSFGLGMYLYFWHTLPILLGAIARDQWQNKWLEPKAKAEKWSEKKKTLKLLDTYMAATGAIIGSAVVGTIVAAIVIFFFS